MANQVTDLEVDEVSAVADPANEDAAIIIAKAKKKAAAMAEAEDDEDMDLDDLLADLEMDDDDDDDDDDEEPVRKSADNDVLDDLEDIEKSVDALVAENARLTRELGEVRKAAGKAADAALDAEVQAMPEPIRKSFLDQRAELEAIRKERAEMEAIEKARTYGHGDPKEIGPLMLRIAKGTTTDADVAVVERILKSAGEALGKVLTPRVTDSGGASDADAIIKAKAAEIRKAKPDLTDAQAYVQALEADPTLYKRG